MKLSLILAALVISGSAFAAKITLPQSCAAIKDGLAVYTLCKSVERDLYWVDGIHGGSYLTLAAPGVQALLLSADESSCHQEAQLIARGNQGRFVARGTKQIFYRIQTSATTLQVKASDGSVENFKCSLIRE